MRLAEGTRVILTLVQFLSRLAGIISTPHAPQHVPVTDSSSMAPVQSRLGKNPCDTF